MVKCEDILAGDNTVITWGHGKGRDESVLLHRRNVVLAVLANGSTDCVLLSALLFLTTCKHT
jgi:hypothetical protein